MRRTHGLGFSLIELAVVVAIMGILASIAIPTFLGNRKHAQNMHAVSNLRNSLAAAEQYLADLNAPITFPTSSATVSDRLNAKEPALSYVTTELSATDLDVVSVDSTDGTLYMAAVSASGDCFMVHYDPSLGVTWAQSSDLPCGDPAGSSASPAFDWTTQTWGAYPPAGIGDGGSGGGTWVADDFDAADGLLTAHLPQTDHRGGGWVDIDGNSIAANIVSNQVNTKSGGTAGANDVTAIDIHGVSVNFDGTLDLVYLGGTGNWYDTRWGFTDRDGYTNYLFWFDSPTQLHMPDGSDVTVPDVTGSDHTFRFTTDFDTGMITAYLDGAQVGQVQNRLALNGYDPVGGLYFGIGMNRTSNLKFAVDNVNIDGNPITYTPPANAILYDSFTPPDGVLVMQLNAHTPDLSIDGWTDKTSRNVEITRGQVYRNAGGSGTAKAVTTVGTHGDVDLEFDGYYFTEWSSNVRWGFTGNNSDVNTDMMWFNSATSFHDTAGNDVFIPDLGTSDHHFLFEVRSDNWTMYVDGVSVYSWSDPGSSSGHIMFGLGASGYGSDATEWHLDNLAVIDRS